MTNTAQSVGEALRKYFSEAEKKITELSRGYGVKLAEIARPSGVIPNVWQLRYSQSNDGTLLMTENYRDCKLLTGKEAEERFQGQRGGFGLLTDIHGETYFIDSFGSSSRFIHRDGPVPKLEFQFRFNPGKHMCIAFAENRTDYVNLDRVKRALLENKSISNVKDFEGVIGRANEFELDLAKKELELHNVWINMMLTQHSEHFL